MNRSKFQDHGFQTAKRSILRYRKADNNYILSTIALMVATMMLMPTKNALAFTSILKVNPFPAFSSVFINRSTNRIASKVRVNHQSERQYGYRRRSSPKEMDGDHVITPPVLVSEGLFAVDKPLEWTSQDVVSFLRGMFERDARARGAKPGKIGSKKNRHLQVVRVGHGGTLDPLATGVLVIGLGNGTKSLQRFERSISQ